MLNESQALAIQSAPSERTKSLSEGLISKFLQSIGWVLTSDQEGGECFVSPNHYIIYLFGEGGWDLVDAVGLRYVDMGDTLAELKQSLTDHGITAEAKQ